MLFLLLLFWLLIHAVPFVAGWVVVAVLLRGAVRLCCRAAR